MLKTRGSLAVALLCSASFAAMPALAKDYLIGAGQALTGAYAFVGVPQTNGAKQAVEDLNAQNFLGGGNKFVLNVYDDANDRGQTMTMLNKAALQDKVLAYIGPSNSAISVAVAPALNDLKIPTISVSTTTQAVDITPYWFKLTTTSEGLVTPLARYAVEKLQIKRPARVYVSDHESHVNQSGAFRDYMKKAGLELVADEGVLARDTDYMAVATKVAQAKPDGIYIGAVGVQAANIAIQLRQAGVPADVKFFGTAGLGEDYVRAGGEAVNNTFSASDYDPTRSDKMSQDFVRNYQATYKVIPDNFAATGYTQMQIIAHAVKASMPDATPDKVRDNLVKLKNIPVVMGSGTWSMTESRIPEYDLAILEVKDGKLVGAPR